MKHKRAGVRGSINLVPSSIKTGEISRILRSGYDARLLNDGFCNLSRRLKLDYLLIDTHPGINEETLLSICCISSSVGSLLSSGFLSLRARRATEAIVYKILQ